LNREQLDFLQKIKEESGISFSKQLDYAVELLKMEHDWDKDQFILHLKAYVTEATESK